MKIPKLKSDYRYSIILLKQLVITDFKLRYQGSILGYAWSLLRPLFLFSILYVVFVQGLKFGSTMEHFPLYLLLGIVLWSFFSEMTGQSLGSIVGRGDLIRKIRIPRWIIILSTSVSAFINLGLNLIVVGIFMFFMGVDVSTSALWFPLAIIEIYLLSLGLSFLLATAYVKYRDVSYIWDLLLQAGFYFTPLLYTLDIVTNEFIKKIIMLNPMAQAIQDARSALVTKQTITIAEVFGTGSARLISIVTIGVLLILGLLYFRREAKSFAENI